MIGRRLLHYEVVEKLGEGGMGVVYKARDIRLNRFVVLKVLRSDGLEDEDRKRRFLQEALAASALNHPNIITVHDIASEGGIAFIVMEFVQGDSLDRMIPPGGMPPPDVLRYAIQVAGALETAHAAGVIHRDLKPANIMVTPAGLVKLLDFGLAKLTGSLASGSGAGGARTVQGSIVGTLAYMSPEQALGRTLDARTDIFSLGAVLYEMLTGRRAFGSSGLAAVSINAVLKENPRPPSSAAAGVPPVLDTLVMKCLEKEPGKRFQTAAEVKAGLESAAHTPAKEPDPPLWAEGRAALGRWTAASLARAKECFEVSLHSAPGHCPVYACISEYYCDSALLGLRPAEQTFAKADWAARKALELEPGSEQAHVSVGLVEAWSRGRWREARDHLVHAQSPDARLRRALWYLRPLGLFAEAEAGLWGHPLGLAWLYLEAGDLRSAAAQAGAADRQHWIASWALAWSLLERGQTADAIGLCRRALLLEPEQPYLDSVLAVGLALGGDTDAARKMMSPARWVPPSFAIPIRAVFGDIDGVFASAAEAARQHDPCLITNLRMPPCAELKSDPRYAAVLQQIGLQGAFLKQPAG
jgi:tRNA A-37 threonylcarbamoyl transferase component Bud32/tetratricopeptide (TPR) repeat protein